MPGEWRQTTLGEVIELKRGYDLPQRERSLGSVPLVSSSGVTDYHSEAKVKGPGVVTGRYGTLGQVFFVRDDFWPLNTTLYVRDFKGNDPRFISYFLTGLDYLAYSDKAAVPGLNRNHLHQATVLFPSDVEEQRAVAHILGALDDKIELNRRMSATLEAMARALFRSWFVDFEPVRAKAEGRDTGLPPHLAALFPDRLVETEHGEVPEGWQTWALRQIATHHRSTLTPAVEPDRVFEHYSIPAHDAGQEPALDRGESIKSNKTIVPDGAVLLSKLNPEISRVWVPKPRGEPPQVASTEFLCFTPQEPAGRALLYCLFKSAGLRTEMEAMVTGTSKSHQRISPSTLMQFDAMVGSDDVFRAFEAKSWPVLDRALWTREEIRTVANIRDTLLPKLISGEMRVKDAETFLHRVL